MKKVVPVLVLAVLALLIPSVSAQDVPQSEVVRAAEQIIIAGVQRIAAQDQQSQPSAEDTAAYSDFQQWAADHMLDGLGRFHRGDDGKITAFDLALATVDADGNENLKWVVYGYPTVKEAATQIESDFASKPDGDAPDGTTYQPPSDKKSADNRVHVASR